MNIVECLNDFASLLNAGRNQAYVKDANAHIQVHSGFGDVIITLLNNAMLRGKDCIQYTIRSARVRYGNFDTINFMSGCANLVDLIDFLNGLNFDSDRFNNEFLVVDGVEIRRNIRESNRVFSPLHLERLKPLSEAPKKWTVTHAIRALVNGQFENLKCDGVYTDDYAYDAATNFQMGEIAAPLEFVAGIFERPNGWRVYDSGNRISVCCHHFDNNSFTLKLAK